MLGWVCTILPSRFQSKFEKKKPNWGPRNLQKECAHPNGWRDKHTHTTTMRSYKIPPSCIMHTHTQSSWKFVCFLYPVNDLSSPLIIWLLIKSVIYNNFSWNFPLNQSCGLRLKMTVRIWYSYTNIDNIINIICCKYKIIWYIIKLLFHLKIGA